MTWPDRLAPIAMIVATSILALVSLAGAAPAVKKPAAKPGAAATSAPPARKLIPNPPGLISFYPRVAARVWAPPSEKSLRVLSDWKLDEGGRVAFVSYGKRLSVLAAFTNEKFKKPEEALFLSPRYVLAKDMKAVQEGREPMVSATAGEMTDWTYVYDRNGDGHADYLAYLVGPMPVEPDSFPADFPVTKGGLTNAQLDYKLDHERYAFTHVADEDFDGTADAVVLYVRDPDRDWVKEYAVVLAPGAGAPDSSWTFRDTIASPTGGLTRVRGGYLRHRDSGRDVVVSSSQFVRWTNVLARINAAADSTKARFPNSP